MRFIIIIFIIKLAYANTSIQERIIYNFTPVEIQKTIENAKLFEKNKKKNKAIKEYKKLLKIAKNETLIKISDDFYVGAKSFARIQLKKLIQKPTSNLYARKLLQTGKYRDVINKFPATLEENIARDILFYNIFDEGNFKERSPIIKCKWEKLWEKQIDYFNEIPKLIFNENTLYAIYEDTKTIFLLDPYTGYSIKPFMESSINGLAKLTKNFPFQYQLTEDGKLLIFNAEFPKYYLWYFNINLNSISEEKFDLPKDTNPWHLATSSQTSNIMYFTGAKYSGIRKVMLCAFNVVQKNFLFTNQWINNIVPEQVYSGYTTLETFLYNNNLFVITSEGIIMLINSISGEIKWIRLLEKGNNIQEKRKIIKVYENTAYVLYGELITAIELYTGKIKWQKNLLSDYSLAEVDNSNLYISYPRGIVMLDKTSGKTKSRIEWGKTEIQKGEAIIKTNFIYVPLNNYIKVIDIDSGKTTEIIKRKNDYYCRIYFSKYRYIMYIATSKYISAFTIKNKNRNNSRILFSLAKTQKKWEIALTKAILFYNIFKGHFKKSLENDIANISKSIINNFKEEKKYDKAVELINKITRYLTLQNKWDILLKLADIYELLDKTNNAIELYLKLLKEVPQDNEVFDFCKYRLEKLKYQ